MRMTSVRKRKLPEGGTIPYAQLGEISSNLFDAVTPTNQYGVKSSFNAGTTGALKGAGTGAALGTALLPGIGTAVGAGVGAIAGAFGGKRQNDKARELQQDDLFLRDQQINNLSSARLNQYDTLGSGQNQIYAKMGGKLPTKYMSGGKLKALSSESVEVEGNSHEEGGVHLGNNVEVEGEETIKGDFVYSDVLGFAKRHKPIARAIGKMEKKVPNNMTNSTIKFLKTKEELLKKEQEDLKEVLGLKPIM